MYSLRVLVITCIYNLYKFTEFYGDFKQIRAFIYVIKLVSTYEIFYVRKGFRSELLPQVEVSSYLLHRWRFGFI